MIIHRLLDVFFKTLDTVDAVRDRIDRARGKAPEPDPWAVDWPPPDAELPTEGSAKKAEPEANKSETKKVEAETPKTADKKKTATKKVGAKKKANSKRKGSVDRSGKDFESERADRVMKWLEGDTNEVITEDGDHGGKKVLARVLWALGAAAGAGEDGMSTADVSALLYKAAKYEVFSTNVGRACRDHTSLIEVASTEGRSKLYRLTKAGKEAAGDLPTVAR